MVVDPIVAALRLRRETLGWNCAQLADRARISVHTIRELESGKTRAGRIDTLRAMANAMGLEILLTPTLVEVGAAGEGREEERHARLAERFSPAAPAGIGIGRPQARPQAGVEARSTDRQRVLGQALAGGPRDPVTHRAPGRNRVA